MENRTIAGYAAVFNADSEDLGGFIERIAPEAFDNVMGDDVRFLINHDPNLLLARTTSGTLRLSKDETGLRYEVDLGGQSYATDLLESIRRGDISQNSFAFRVEKEEWKTVNGQMTRTIKSLKKLSDASIVTYPAYPDAKLALRSLQKISEDSHKLESEKRERQLQLINLNQ